MDILFRAKHSSPPDTIRYGHALKLKSNMFDVAHFLLFQKPWVKATQFAEKSVFASIRYVNSSFHSKNFRKCQGI